MNGVREQTPVEQANSQVVTYTRPNGDDIVGNENLIENIRDEQSRDIIDNCRVGNYDSQGNYVIDADIVKELIGMNKSISRKAFEKVTSENKTEVEFKLTGNIPLFGEMEFRLVVTKFDARLYLIEEVFREGGGYLETYGEKIAEYVSDRVEKDDLQNIFATFNIRIADDDDEDEGKKFKGEDDQIVDKLLIRKIYLSLLAKNLVDYTAAEEKESFDKIVEILKGRGGEYGKRVLRNFIDRLERRPEIMGIKDKNGYNKALNDMLIGSLEVATTEEDMKDENIRKIFEEINGIRNKRTQEHIDKAKQLITAEQVKQVYDKIKGPGQGGLTLTEIQKAIEDTQTTLTKQPVSKQPTQAILKQETREAILKQTPKNAVVEETAAPVEAAAVKKESPAEEKSSTPKPAKKEEKSPAKKPSPIKSSPTKSAKPTKPASGSKDKGKDKGKDKPASFGSGGGQAQPQKIKDTPVFTPLGGGFRQGGRNPNKTEIGGDLRELADSLSFQEFRNMLGQKIKEGQISADFQQVQNGQSASTPKPGVTATTRVTGTGEIKITERPDREEEDVDLYVNNFDPTSTPSGFDPMQGGGVNAEHDPKAYDPTRNPLKFDAESPPQGFHKNKNMQQTYGQKPPEA